MVDGTRMQQRRATEAVWTTSDYVLAAGELGVTTDTGIIKIGNGTTPWSGLDPAFDSQYLPLLGKAADSELLDGVSAAFFVKSADADTNPTANTYVKRLSDGRVKGATATDADDLTPLAQQTSAISTASSSTIVSARQEAISRAVTSATTIATGDVGKMVTVNHASLTAQVVISVPTNVLAAIPVGSWVDICAIGAGGVKLAPLAGVTFRGTSNVFPNYGIVRCLKIATDEWVGIALSNQRQSRLPKIRVYKNTGGTSYTAGAYTFIPYDTVDSTVDFYNPDNEWFSIGGAGIATTRRVLINKDGEYLITQNFAGNTGVGSSIRIAMMVADNTLTGGRVLGVQPTNGTGNLTVRARITAGQGIGAGHFANATNTDLADGAFDNRNDLTITRIGD